MPLLEDLLVSGTIEPLEFLMSRAEVSAKIGPPEKEFISDGEVFEKRGDIELRFRVDELVRLTWRMGAKQSDRFGITNETLSSSSDPFDFVEYCNQIGVYGWSIYEPLTQGHRIAIRACESVVATFDINKRELAEILVAPSRGWHAFK